MKLTPWEKCSQCEEFWCNLHDLHASVCPCPSIHHWLEAKPYDEIELEINMEAITGAPSRPEKLVDMPEFHGGRVWFPKLGDE